MIIEIFGSMYHEVTDLIIEDCKNIGIYNANPIIQHFTDDFLLGHNIVTDENKDDYKGFTISCQLSSSILLYCFQKINIILKHQNGYIKLNNLFLTFSNIKTDSNMNIIGTFRFAFSKDIEFIYNIQEKVDLLNANLNFEYTISLYNHVLQVNNLLSNTKINIKNNNNNFNIDINNLHFTNYLLLFKI